MTFCLKKTNAFLVVGVILHTKNIKMFVNIKKNGYVLKRRFSLKMLGLCLFKLRKCLKMP